MIVRNLNHLMGRAYLEPLIEQEKRNQEWKEFEQECRDEENRRQAERKARYAERGVIGKIALFSSELWQDEKDAWASRKKFTREERQESFKAFSGVALMIVFIWFFLIAAMIFTDAFGFSFFVGYGDEALARVALYAVMASALCLFILIYAMISDALSKDDRPRGARRLKAKDIKPYWMGALFCLAYAVVSVIIDWITGNYLYNPETNSFLLMGLVCIYGAAAFFTLFFWTMAAQIDPHFKNNEEPPLLK